MPSGVLFGKKACKINNGIYFEMPGLSARKGEDQL